MLSCSQHSEKFINVPSSKTHIDFANNLESREDLWILNYIYYYNGAGVAVGDINNDGLPDIYFAANSKGHNKLYLNKGNFEFEDITDKAGVSGSADWCTGVTMADVNGDGFLDIYVCAVANMHGLKGRNELFINNGNGTFTESAPEYGLDFSGFSTQAVFFDYDHDGDLDCFILNQSEHPNQNIFDTSFRRGFDPNAGERLFRNDHVNGKIKFTDVSSTAGIYQSKLCYGLGVAVGDLNNDGWEDIYVGNDFHENDYYYINNGDGTFKECGADHFRHYSRYSMGNDIADFNNDGQPDIITVDMLPADERTLKTYGNGEHLDTYEQKITRNGYQNQYSKNCLQKNNGAGVSFSDVGLISGVSATDWSWSPLFADFDNDGNKDLFISSGIVKRPLDLDFAMFFSGIKDPGSYGSLTDFQQAMLDKMPDGPSHPYFFKGDGHLLFKDVSSEWGTAGMKGFYTGATYADLDNDGKEDVIINCLNAPAVILKNETTPKNYISISFYDDEMNTSGIGVKAYLFIKGKLQYQQLMLTRGFMSATEPKLHFGVDTAKIIDSILVVWPDMKFQVLKQVSSDQQLTISKKNASGVFNNHSFFQQPPDVLKDITSDIHCGWKHIEDSYTDFNVQYFLPHEESTRGPKIAVGDINKDGLEDFFLCGAKGQRGSLMLQQKNKTFVETDSLLFSRYSAGENVDAVFFDANNDGYDDLLVINGGNEYQDGNPNLKDHLYINNTDGHFHESSGALPELLVNKTCIAVADVNNDGFKDIFIGGFAGAVAYGYAQPSYLLLNDGKGRFHLAGESAISLQNAGMVTCAAFLDINRDGWTDLVIAGEWMPLKIFMNDHGKFKDTDLPQSNGLWQNLFVTDINGDGYPDILAGNWGENSKLHAMPDAPLKLYIKDFNNNGVVDQVMSYTVEGKEYSFLGKDQLEMALPFLKKMHYSYDEVAGKTVQYLFGDTFQGCRTLKAETLNSVCFFNDTHGGFRKIKLPEELQFAPLFAFDSISAAGKPAYISAGNFYGVLPYEGRYDAMTPTIFYYDKSTAAFVVQSTLPGVSGEARDIKWIRCGSEPDILILARNNQPLIFFRRKYSH